VSDRIGGRGDRPELISFSNVRNRTWMGRGGGRTKEINREARFGGMMRIRVRFHDESPLVPSEGEIEKEEREMKGQA